jgi:purine-binding chemotaxis protein CheW
VTDLENASTATRSIADGVRQYATFFVGGLYCGIDVLRVQEVLRPQRMTRVPLAPSVIEGLINLRGQIVTAVDMRQCLRLPRRTDGQSPMNMVVRGEGSAVSLLVDGIGDVIEVHSNTFETPPENLGPELKCLIQGVHKLDGRLLLVLNTDRILRLEDFNRTRPFRDSVSNYTGKGNGNDYDERKN